MTTSLDNFFPQKQQIHHQTTKHHNISIYDTVPFGKIMLIDNQIYFAEHDNFIAHEMLVHPALFTHKNPKKVALFGDGALGFLQEILKHPDIEEIHLIETDAAITEIMQKFFPQLAQSIDDPRICFSNEKKCKPGYFDIIIALTTKTTNRQNYFNWLHAHGMLVVSSASTFQLKDLKHTIDKLESLDFADLQILQFSQPSYPFGARSAILALKHGIFSRPRETKIFTKPFATQYYNFDIHQASLVLPEFARQELPI